MEGAIFFTGLRSFFIFPDFVSEINP